MINKESAWSGRFNTGLSDPQMKSALRIGAAPLTHLATLPPQQAAVHLRDNLQKTFVPTAQVLRVVRHLTEVAKSYSEIAYPDCVSVLRRIYDPEAQSTRTPIPAICLMGLAGTGKSEILAAFARLHSARPLAVVPNHSELELRAFWSLRLHDRATLGDLVLPQFRAKQERTKSKVVACKAVSELAGQGVAVILADEFQFVTGSEANVMAAKLLLQLTELGPPLVYACNYSLVHRLWKRPSQERDRILSKPIVIQPESRGEDWASTVTEFLKVAPEFSALDAEKVCDLLHSYCFGIKRALKELLVLAYLEMRRNREVGVTQAHIAAAYVTPGFASMRSDVEQLMSGSVNSSRLDKNLRAPFDIPVETPPSGPVSQHPAVADHARRTAQAALESLTSPAERDLLDLLSDAGQRELRKPVRAVRPPPTAQNLIGGAERFARDEQNDKK